jgi:nitrate/nitrite transporter NarK
VGFDYFLIKVLDVQFQKSASEANVIFSGVSLGAAVAVVVGGYVSKRFKFSLPQMLLLLLVITCLQLVLMASMIATSCPQIHFANLTTYEGPVTGFPQLNISTSCSGADSSGCSCSTVFQPICGSDGETYYSPCVAGCTSLLNDSYSSCGCIAGEGAARPGHCDHDCMAGVVYVVMVVFLRFGTAFSRIYLFAVCISSVTEANKTFALGIRSMFGSLIGGYNNVADNLRNELYHRRIAWGVQRGRRRPQAARPPVERGRIGYD